MKVKYIMIKNCRDKYSWYKNKSNIIYEVDIETAGGYYAKIEKNKSDFVPYEDCEVV